MKHNKLILIFAVVISTFGFNACTRKQVKKQDNVKYYRNILFSETSWDLERGSHPLTAEQAKTINN